MSATLIIIIALSFPILAALIFVLNRLKYARMCKEENNKLYGRVNWESLRNCGLDDKLTYWPTESLNQSKEAIDSGSELMIFM